MAEHLRADNCADEGIGARVVPWYAKFLRHLKEAFLQAMRERRVA